MVKVFKSKLTIGIALMVSLWVLTDVNSRFVNKDKILPKSSVRNINDKFNLPQLNAHHMNTLQETYAKYQTDGLSAETNNKKMSAEEQKKQNGLLNALYIDGNKLQLKAVMENKTALNKSEKVQLQVLLLITNVDTGDKKVEKFTNQSLVYGYQLQIEKNTQVTLTKKQNKQKITLTMYKGQKG